MACFFHTGVLTSRGWTISGVQGPCSGTSACMWLLCFPPTSCQMRVLCLGRSQASETICPLPRGQCFNPQWMCGPLQQDALNTSTGVGWTACFTQHLPNATRCWSPGGPLLQHSRSPESCQLWRGQLSLGGAELRAPGGRGTDGCEVVQGNWHSGKWDLLWA